MVLPFVSAGSPSSPEVSDTVGDGARPALDIASLWITQEPRGATEAVVFHLKVKDLSNLNPVQGQTGDLGYQWILRYSVNGVARSASYTITLVKERATTQSTDTFDSLVVDQATNTIHFGFRKTNALTPGAAISGLQVSTWLSTINTPDPTQGGFEADKAVSAATYTVS